MIDGFKRRLRQLGSDRIVWRIVGTIVLAILGAQAATVALLYVTRPKEVPLYSIGILAAEMVRHTAGEAPQANDILMRVAHPGGVPEESARKPFPFRDVQRRLEEALLGPKVEAVTVTLEFPRPYMRAMIMWAAVPRIVAPLAPSGEPPPLVRPQMFFNEAPGPRPPLPPPMDDDFLVPGIFTIWAKAAGGNGPTQWMAFRPKLVVEPISPVAVTFLWFAVIIVIIGGLAVWSTWRLLRPLKSLVAAAQQWRAEQEPKPIPERGPVEFRAITTAFNAMQQEISRFVRDRSELVIALSHDLRTPLTRLQLRAEYVEDAEQRQRMLDELHFMQMLTDQLLAFASFDPQSEPVEKVDLAVMLGSLCDDRTDAGAVIEYAGPTHLVVFCRPTAILRALMNLIDNAIKYSDYAYVALVPKAEGVEIFVRDSGPGIPEADLSRVFEPFYRVEASRNRETGGLGMGLSVARAIILEHRGRIALRNRQPHGLEVEIFLPYHQGGSAFHTDGSGHHLIGRLQDLGIH